MEVRPIPLTLNPGGRRGGGGGGGGDRGVKNN